MATGVLLPSGYETLENANGNCVPFGLIWTYAAGTTTPISTFQDAGLTLANTFPIVADAAGRWRAYAALGQSYKLVMETPPITPTQHGATIKTLDNVSGPIFTGQLAFPPAQVQSSDPNTLDDYEEGTFTPTLSTTSGGSGQVYQLQAGNYIKVGRMVHVQLDLYLSNKGTLPGFVQIQGLPFTSLAGNAAGMVSYFEGLSLARSFMTPVVQGAGMTLTAMGAGGSVTAPVFDQTVIGNVTRIIAAAQYETSA